MSRAMRTLSCAAVAVLAGIAGQAWADEGPAVNPVIYKVPAGAKTINVDCDAQQTLAAALGDKSGADLNVVFSGTCKEYVYIQRDGVAIRGKDASAAVAGAIEITSGRRILLENFTCRDNAQLEYCIGAILGSAVTLHNIKVFNSGIRGVMIHNSTALIDGLTVDKTVSTSLIARGSNVRLEGELNFSNTVEGCVVLDGGSFGFSKNSQFTARDCAVGLTVESNSTFQAPFAMFNLSANKFAGLMTLTHGSFSYGGSLVIKNNGKAGIYVDDLSSFGPFSNIEAGSTVTLESNGGMGVFVAGGSFAELATVTNTGSNFGVLVDGGILRMRHSKLSDNKTADLRLTGAGKAYFGEGVTLGNFTCDGTQFVRGAKTPCTVVESKPAPKPEAAK